MKRRTIVIYVLLFAAALFLTAYSGSVPKEKPPLQLELVLPKHRFEAGEPIECKAVLTYVGDEESVKVYFENPIVMFSVDGGEYLRAELYSWPLHDIENIPAITRVIKRGEPIEFPFAKYRVFRGNEDDKEKAFWENYNASSELILEAGRYKIYARCAYSLKNVTAHGPFQEIIVNEKIIVK